MERNATTSKGFIKSLQKGIITTKIVESKNFYQKWMNMEVKFETEWFILMNLIDSPDFELAFMLPNQPSVRKKYFQEAYAGKGICLIFECSDVKACYIGWSFFLLENGQSIQKRFISYMGIH